MNQDSLTSTSAPLTLLATKSWTAYLKTALIAGIALLALWPMLASTSTRAGAAFLLVVLAAIVFYRFIELRSHRLYADELGVWHARGVLPWTRGVVGVKWRDVDEASYVQGMGSWLFGSYTIRVGHRFTKSSEIVLAHMARGDQAAMRVNTTHADLVRENRLS